MKMKKLSGEDFSKSVWSGGTTTQIAIAPAGASYAARDFLWRVSSATVELEESTFTALPDYERRITTLTGEITLRHDGGEPIRLRPGEVHAFSGADETQSVGRCTDFNLMLRRGRADGTMEALRLEERETRLIEAEREEETLLLYAARGGCTLDDGAQRLSLAAGEAARAEGPVTLRCAAEGQSARLILCRIFAPVFNS